MQWHSVKLASTCIKSKSNIFIDASGFASQAGVNDAGTWFKVVWIDGYTTCSHHNIYIHQTRIWNDECARCKEACIEGATPVHTINIYIPDSYRVLRKCLMRARCARRLHHPFHEAFTPCLYIYVLVWSTNIYMPLSATGRRCLIRVWYGADTFPIQQRLQSWQNLGNLRHRIGWCRYAIHTGQRRIRHSRAFDADWPLTVASSVIQLVAGIKKPLL